ncbi:MAG TPA: VWA domain-containing protein [Acidobacteriota bacterium]|nr:VWA domain-containing protein [Acidobacteriota bacterium]
MKRKLALVVLVALVSFLLNERSTSGQEPKKPQTPAPETQGQKPRDLKEKQEAPRGRTAIRVNVNQVSVDATVMDKDGNLIKGLTKDNFKIYEDKVAQTIANFAPVDAPITVVLLVEYNKVIWYALYEVLVASYQFVEQIRPEDWVAVIAYDIRPEILTDFTQNKAEVYNALRRLNYPAWSEANFYDASIDVLNRVQEIDGKVAIVMLTSGRDTFSKVNLDHTLKAVKSSSAVIYPISIGGNIRARYEDRMAAETRLDFYQADAVLKEYAKATGGVSFFPRFQAEYPNIFHDISNMLRSQYRLSYVPTNTAKDGKYRKIRVEAKADIHSDGKTVDLKVRAREGYYAEKTVQ